jgi:hypothetical protein
MTVLLRVAAVFCVVLASNLFAHGDETSDRGESSGTTSLVFACDEGNDLFRALIASGVHPKRFDSANAAVDAASQGAAVLILADGYPQRRTVVNPSVFERAKSKQVQVLVEFPESVPGVTFGAPRGARWERGIVAKDTPDLGLPALHLLALHDCLFLPTKSTSPLLVIGRVAGFDQAVFGLPADSNPILFEAEKGVWVATTKISNFVTARYAPSADWLMMWSRLLDELDPRGSPHKLVAEEIVHPAFKSDETLPADAELRALDGCANWYKNSRLLISQDRESEIHRALSENMEVLPPPPASAPEGDGKYGILEGYASQILPDGSQLQRTPIRADCQAESAAVLALHANIAEDASSEAIARNLLDYLYFNSELHQRERGDPHHPAYGLIAWGAVSPAWRVGNYGDDNARTLLATMLCAAVLESDKWDESMLRALYANLRTTGKLGFRGDRVDVPQLEDRGWKAFQQGDVVNLSPSFEAYSWACFLWAYDRTGDRAFLDATKKAIRQTMLVYPEGWRWGDNLDRSRMILVLAWLIRVEDTEEHRAWLKLVAGDLIRNQQPCGAIPEELSGTTSGHFVAPASNESYGTSETPLIQEEGDPVSDQLYVTNFTLFGLREAVAATNDPSLKEAEDRLAEYITRIQVRSKAIPYLDGTWFRAFDFHRWDYWSSSGDMGWGAWCAETGWGPAWNGISLGLRAKNTSLWELTRKSRIVEQREEVLSKLSENSGGPL